MVFCQINRCNNEEMYHIEVPKKIEQFKFAEDVQ